VTDGRTGQGDLNITSGGR